MKRNRAKTSPKTPSDVAEPTLPTFMDHVRELQGRLFAIGGVFIVAAAAAYPFFDKIINVLLAPLGDDHQLVYLTPGGAFSFIIQVCMFVGLVGALPAIIYNVYRFFMPAMKQRTLKKAIIFTISSLVLALAGMVFAYVVSLPAALYFLTGFDLYHIDPMLTIDSYFSFVMTYLLAGALLFQIPLIMLLINGATPLQPKKLMRFQDKIILGSFIVAAIISPTPDALNQTLLASPMIVMYQAGIVLVLLRNRRKTKTATSSAPIVVTPTLEKQIIASPSPLTTLPGVQLEQERKNPLPAAVPLQPTLVRARRSIDGFAPRGQAAQRVVVPQQRPLPVMQRQLQRSNTSQRPQVRRTIDGFIAPARA